MHRTLQQSFGQYNFASHSVSVINILYKVKKYKHLHCQHILLYCTPTTLCQRQPSILIYTHSNSTRHCVSLVICHESRDTVAVGTSQIDTITFHPQIHSNF